MEGPPRGPTIAPWASRRYGGGARASPGPPPLVARGRGLLVQLAAHLADLVAQLRGVLEAQLLGGDEHLLLELDDRALELGRRHVDALLAAAASALGHLALAHQELGDVGDALDDRLRRDPVLLVVRTLDLAAAVGFVDRLAHRVGLLVG